MLESQTSSLTQPRLSEIISALSLALDLTEGQPMGHSINSCLIGMKIGAALRLSDRELYDLYFALLLKDTGCSSNAARMHEVFGSDDLKAKREVKMQDWTRVSLDGLKYLGRNMKPDASAYQRAMAIGQMALQRERRAREFTAIRCERGAQIALRLGFSARTAQAIRNLDELWNGKGHPRGIRGAEIPMASRIMNIAQVIEVFAAARGPSAAMKVIRERRGTWFDPDVVTPPSRSRKTRRSGSICNPEPRTRPSSRSNPATAFPPPATRSTTSAKPLPA